MNHPPPCPCCKRRNIVVRQGEFWFCKFCGLFDDSPDEGGTHHDRDPSRRLEREESGKRQFNKRR